MNYQHRTDMPIQDLNQAIEVYPANLQGVKVGTRLWVQLVESNRITWVRGFIEGILDSGIDLPVLDKKIFVHVDPSLKEDAFELPQT